MLWEKLGLQTRLELWFCLLLTVLWEEVPNLS